MNIDKNHKTVILEAGEEFTLAQLFNIVHEIDADNADQWKVVTLCVTCVVRSQEYIIPPEADTVYPNPGADPYNFTITCDVSDKTFVSHSTESYIINETEK